MALDRSDWLGVAAMLGLAGIFATMHRQTLAGDGGVMSRGQIRALAAAVIQRHGLRVDADVATAIALVESSGNPQATRYESWIAHLGGGDVSTGLMQVLVSTARWLADDMGYRAYGPSPSGADMLTPEVGMYFGLAYLDYLGRYNGASRSVEWVVQSYNAGPGNASPAYLAKFRAAGG